jgi:hypothetical protein
LIKYNFVLTTPEETQPLLTVPTHIWQWFYLNILSFF